MFNSNLSLFAKTLTLTSALFFLSSCAQEEPVYEAPPQSNSIAADQPSSHPTRGRVTFSDISKLSSDECKFDYSGLREIADSYEYFLQPPNNPYAHEITYSVGDYRDGSKSGSLTGGLLVRVWNIYSTQKQANLYLIHFETQTLFSEAYKGIYSKAVTTDGIWNTIAKVVEWYGKQVQLKVEPARGSFYKEAHYPNTDQTSKDYSSSIGVSFGICVGKKDGKFSVEARPSISVTDSQSYSVADVTAEDYSKMDNLLSWKFNINNEPDCWFNLWSTSCTEFNEACATAKSSLTARADAVIAFPYDANNPPRLKVSYQVTLASICGKAGKPCGRRTKQFPADNKMEELIIDLPYITPEQAAAAQKNAK